MCGSGTTRPKRCRRSFTGWWKRTRSCALTSRCSPLGIYGTRLDYTLFEPYLSGKDTRGIHSSGGYGGGTMTTFVRNRPGDLTRDGSGPFEETFRHEYAHYLADRFGLLRGGPWFDEGLAEFLVGQHSSGGRSGAR